MKTALVFAALTMALDASAALGQTAQDRQACIGDVMRLCSSAIPSRGRVIACILHNQSRLGADCRAVVARYTGRHGGGSQHADKPRIEQAVNLE